MASKKEKLDREPITKRRPIIEFSDTELISEDEEQVPPEGNNEHLRNRLVFSNIPLERRLDQPKTGRQHVTRQPRSDQNPEEILTPKPKKRSDEPVASKRILSSVFLWQLFITLSCVALFNFIQVSFLIQSVHVSGSPVNLTDLINEVKKVIGEEVPKTLYPPLQDPDREKAKTAVTDFDLKTYIKNQIAEHNGEILRDIDSVKSDINVTFNNLFQDKTKNAKCLNDTLMEEVQEKIIEIFSNLNGTSSNITELSNNYTRLSNTATNHSDANVKLQEKLQNQRKKIDDAITSITTKIEYLNGSLLDAEKLNKEYKAKLKQLKEVEQKLEQMQPNMFNKEKFTMAFMILVLIVLGLAIALFCLYQRQNNMFDTRPRGHTTTASNDFSNMDNNEILKQVSRAVKLEQEVCIISFDESRSQAHQHILDSAEVPNLQVQTCVIRKHEQILKMPQSKVYLMCTEFSERHVIIEEPGLGLGDLHRTTYQAAEKIGGCLIILYTKDPGSRKLNDNSLYNVRIHCVKSQPELSELNADGRFFSLYDELTQLQKTKLRNKIVQNMA